MCNPPGSNRILSITFIPCQFKVTYIWLNNNTGVWTKPIHLFNDFIECWVWNIDFWTLAQIPLRNIEAFICS
jgi:hypothetical protein